MSTITFCLGHTAPKFMLSDDIIFVSLGDYRHPGKGFHIGDYGADLTKYHIYLASVAGTIACARYLSQSAVKYQFIRMYSYRRFITKQSFSDHNGLGNSRIITQAQANEIGLKYEDSVTTPFLVSAPINLGGTYKQYANAHNGIDFLRFLALSLEFELLTDEDIPLIINNKLMFLFGFDVGVFPTDFFMPIMIKIEQISIKFVQLHLPADLSPYQRRAIAFCTERVVGYLISKHLMMSRFRNPSNLEPGKIANFMKVHANQLQEFLVNRNVNPASLIDQSLIGIPHLIEDSLEYTVTRT